MKISSDVLIFGSRSMVALTIVNDFQHSKVLTLFCDVSVIWSFQTDLEIL